MKNNKGFTLIELLAVIAILGVIASITLFISNDLISNSKKKSYQSTVNNIEKTTGSYLEEYKQEAAWISEDYDEEKMCISVNDLIDTGFFNNDILESKVSENKNVRGNDYVYLLRNKETKAITLSKLLTDDASINVYCDIGIANINISLLPNGWSTEKSVSVSFRVQSSSVSYTNYTYEYYVGGTLVKSSNFNGLVENELLTLDRNTTVLAKIIDKDGNVTSKTFEVTTIDREAPIVLASLDNTKYAKNHIVTFDLKDSLSGLKENSEGYIINYEISKTPVPCSKMTKSFSSWTWKDSTKKEVDAELTVSEKMLGETNLYWCLSSDVSDNAGNKLESGSGSITLKFDNVAPTIEINPDGKVFNTNTYSTSLGVSDDGAGIKEILYVWSSSTNIPSIWDGANKVTVTSSNYITTTISNTSNEGGNKYLIVKATDNADNVNVFVSKAFVVNMPYTIKYNLNNGVNASGNPTSATYGTAFKLLKPSKTVKLSINKNGYTNLNLSTSLVEGNSTFNGWNATGIDETRALYGLNVASVNLKWDGKTLISGNTDQIYINNLLYNGGSATLVANWSSRDLTIPTVSSNGKTCGFSDVKSGSIKYNGGAKITLTDSKTLYVICNANNYNITYEYNGGSAPSSGIPKTYTYGVGATINGVPTKANYTFDGWSFDGTTGCSTSKVISTTMIGDKKVYACWTPVKYTITYYDGGTKLSLSPTEYTYGTSTDLPSPTKTGYDFGGWCTSSNTTNCTAINSLTSTDSGNKTLYAKWSDNEYAITYELYGGKTPDTGVPASYTYGVGATINGTSKKTGYTFDGWKTDTDTSCSLTRTIGTTDTGSQTFYACWSINSYAITYDLGGGIKSSVGMPTSYTYGVGATINGIPSKTGYKFDGWSTTSGRTSCSATQVINEYATNDKKFYACWSAKSYDITYDLVGGTKSSTGMPTSYTYGVGATINGTPTKSGYKFTGWSYKDDVTCSSSKTISTSSTGTKKLYACWESASYSITYYDGSTKLSLTPSSYTKGTVVNLPGASDVAKVVDTTNKTFGGWCSSNDVLSCSNSANIFKTISSTSSGNKTYYAIWEYDIMYDQSKCKSYSDLTCIGDSCYYTGKNVNSEVGVISLGSLSNDNNTNCVSKLCEARGSRYGNSMYFYSSYKHSLEKIEECELLPGKDGMSIHHGQYNNDFSTQYNNSASSGKCNLISYDGINHGGTVSYASVTTFGEYCAITFSAKANNYAFVDKTNNYKVNAYVSWRTVNCVGYINTNTFKHGERYCTLPNKTKNGKYLPLTEQCLQAGVCF